MKVRLIEAQGLTISYNNNPILSNISFEIEEGDWVQIQGFNGEGKSTLIKTLLGILPYTGSLKIKGKEVRDYTIKEIKELFSYLPQRLELIPKITVSDFLSLCSSEKDKIVSRLGLSHLLTVSLTNLSLGQLQLVLMAQVLLKNTEIIILDEPTSSVDIENKDKIYSIIKELSLSGKTVLLVNHDMDRRYVSTKLITLSNSQCYSTAVVVKNKVEYKNESLPHIPLLLYSIIMVILLGVSVFLPSNTPNILRIVWAILSGGVLAFTGASFQSLFHNPLASPYTLGLASGSSIGALSAFLFGVTSIFGTSLVSFIGGITSSLLLLLVPRCKVKDNSFLLLCGIAYASFVSSLSMVLQSFVDTSTAYTYLRWMLGGLEIEEYKSLFLIPFVLLPLVFIYRYSNQITSLGIDTDIAQVSGIDPLRTRRIVLLLSTISISLIVSQTGPLSFVGLVIPNIIRRKYGVNLKKTFPLIFIIGVSFTLFSDILTRIVNIYSLPVTTGVTMAIVGSPLLIYSLFRTKDN